MVKLTYKQRITQDQKSKDAQSAEHQSKTAELQVQADLLETQHQVALAEQRLEELKSATPLSVKAVIEQQDILKGYQQGEQAILDLQKELFPAKK